MSFQSSALKKCRGLPSVRPIIRDEYRYEECEQSCADRSLHSLDSAQITLDDIPKLIDVSKREEESIGGTHLCFFRVSGQLFFNVYVLQLIEHIICLIDSISQLPYPFVESRVFMASNFWLAGSKVEDSLDLGVVLSKPFKLLLHACLPSDLIFKESRERSEIALASLLLLDHRQSFVEPPPDHHGCRNSARPPHEARSSVGPPLEARRSVGPLLEARHSAGLPTEAWRSAGPPPEAPRLEGKEGNSFNFGQLCISSSIKLGNKHPSSAATPASNQSSNDSNPLICNTSSDGKAWYLSFPLSLLSSHFTFCISSSFRDLKKGSCPKGGRVSHSLQYVNSIFSRLKIGLTLFIHIADLAPIFQVLSKFLGVTCSLSRNFSQPHCSSEEGLLLSKASCLLSSDSSRSSLLSSPFGSHHYCLKLSGIDVPGGSICMHAMGMSLEV
ncbi:hypothetical protein M5K25_009733 [Dendrobium thyrsiflorum]|uniref:Uncharacterized protein n=1 Tax=Dendrobium thyrsiflorum TaxID=117978 RepID=A0ABD0V7K6_DENTH